MDIPVGAPVSIEITAPPRSEAAQKTLMRLCRKDLSVVRHHRKQQTKRPSWEEWIRGGKYWHHQMKSKPAVQIEAGQKYEIRATLDVIRDLKTVERWVKVTPK